MLHWRILAWDIKSNLQSPLPPDVDSNPDLIPSTFPTPITYQNALSPPLFVECWEQVRQAYQSPGPALELDLLNEPKVEDPFTLIDAEVRCDFFLQEDPIWDGDLVRIEHRGKSFQAICVACQPLAMMGRYRVMLRCCSPIGPIDIHGSTEMRKLLSVGRAMQEHGLNESQATALAKSVTGQGFSLIQGPPGTGKTSTIVALVAAHRAQRERLLICAPSNAAVDEIAKRLMRGLPEPNGSFTPIKVVRLGREDDPKVDREVVPILLRNLVSEEFRQRNQKPTGEQWNRLRIEVLSKADVVISTLSGAGGNALMKLPFDFPTVIIDEAGQSVEVSSLIPLKYGCTRCILVGDPKQLPPTVMSPTAKDAKYDRGLFVRIMEQDPDTVNFLSVQHRMHPQISSFPSARFYGGRLTDAPGMSVKTRKPWHDSPLFPPYAFMDVTGREAKSGTSKFNKVAAETALALYSRLVEDFPPTEDFAYSIGVVSPYKAQVEELERIFKNKFGIGIVERVAFNTVDGFQGQEKDIIILSCVRAGAGKTVGFLSDTRRMNVALTRAKSSCWVLGDSKRLAVDQDWHALVEDSKVRGHYRKIDASTFLKPRTIPGLPTNLVPPAGQKKKQRSRKPRRTTETSDTLSSLLQGLNLGLEE
ncbi:hypothetical protein RQP46_002583 [Phenoliferia psychrophenolica]